jgi:integrase
MKPLSALAVDKLKKSAFVGGVAGLQLCVSDTRRSWRLYYRLSGHTKRRAMRLGPYPEISLGSARTRAREALALAAAGNDPVQERIRRVETAITVDEALDEHLKFCDGENGPRTVEEKRIAFRTHIRPPLGSRILRSLDSGDWMKAIDALGRRAGARRNLYAYTRRFLSWAAERRHIGANPLLGIKPPRKVQSRERTLTADEIRALWSIQSVTADLARLALLTAQREASLGAMRRDQIDFKKRIWTIPGAMMKSGKAHCVPLSDMAIEILGAQMRMNGPYVFGVSSTGEKPFNGFSNGMDGLRKQLAGEASLQGQRVSAAAKKARVKAASERKTTQWRFHDLRRTAVTLAQAARQPLDDIRALTQHKIGGVLGTYARHAYDEEMRRVVDAIAVKISEIVDQ